jgi:hypothetical protein
LSWGVALAESRRITTIAAIDFDVIPGFISNSPHLCSILYIKGQVGFGPDCRQSGSYIGVNTSAQSSGSIPGNAAGSGIPVIPGSSQVVKSCSCAPAQARYRKIVSSVDKVPRPGHRSTETPLPQRRTSAKRCARTAELPRVERDLHRKCSQLLALVRNRKLELPPLKGH